MSVISSDIARGDPRLPRPRGRLTAAEKVRRDAALVTDRNRGLTWAEVARRHDVSITQARNVHRAWRAENESLPVRQEPLEWLWRTLERYESIQHQLAGLAETGDNTAARVGALRAQMDAILAQTQLLVASGLLPRDLRGYRERLEAKEIVTRFFDTLERHHVLELLTEPNAGTELRAELRDILGG